MHSTLTDLFNCKGVTIYAHRFAVYLPSKLSDETPIDAKRYEVLCQMTSEFLCDELGGVTTFPAVGTWIDKSKRPHCEQVQVVESYCKQDVLSAKAKRIRDFVNALAIEFEQAVMTCVIDGEMAFFEPEKEYRKTHCWIGAKPMAERDADSVPGFIFNFLEREGVPFLAMKP